MSRPDWNERYASGDLPWDTGRPDVHLVGLVDDGGVTPGRALEVGCGTGTNALWLATRGFDVLGIDVAPLAIERATSKSGRIRGQCEFRVLDFVTDPVEGPFDLVFDRGCFHSFDHAADRSRFALRVRDVLAPGGRWVSIVGSTEGPERDHGPPRRSLRDIADAVEPSLEILEVRSTHMDAMTPTTPAAWLIVAARRDVPAQPSTMRDRD